MLYSEQYFARFLSGSHPAVKVDVLTRFAQNKYHSNGCQLLPYKGISLEIKHRSCCDRLQ